MNNEDSQVRQPVPELPPKAKTIAAQLAPYRRSFLLTLLVIVLLAVLAYIPHKTLMVMWRGLLAQRLLVALLLLFSVVTLSLLFTAGQRIDALVFMYFNKHQIRRPWLDRTMFLVTQIGNGLLAVIGALILYFSNQKRLGIELLIGVVTLWMAVETVKALTDRSRPFITIVNTKVVGWKERGRSFPSGHTAQTFFLVALLSHYFRPGPLGILMLYAIALLVGFTRVYVGVHYPRDAIGGAILGSVWGILIVLADAYLSTRFLTF